MTITELTAPPSIVGSFVRSVRPGRRRSHTVPDRELMVRELRTDPARLAAYQRLCGFAVSSSVPTTFVHVQAFPLAVAIMSDPAFPLPLLGLVHVRNVMTQHRPVDSGERLTVHMHAADLREHPSGQQVDLVGEARVGSELVWTGVATYLHRAERTTDAVRLRPATEPAVPTALWRLPADIGRRYAAVSGDRNPIHLSTLSAKAFGFPRTIAHGMYLHARALAALDSRLPDAYAVDAAFKTPALLPSTVAVETVPTTAGWDVRISAARTGKPHFTAGFTAAA